MAVVRAALTEVGAAKAAAVEQRAVAAKAEVTGGEMGAARVEETAEETVEEKALLEAMAMVVRRWSWSGRRRRWRRWRMRWRVRR